MKNLFTITFLSLLITTLQAQNFVSTNVSNKNVLLETIGGINCYYCAESNYTAQTLQNNHSNRIVWVNIHGGIFAQPVGNDADFRSTYANDLVSFSGINSYPAAMLNRRLFSSLAQSQGHYAIGYSNWSQAADSILAETAPVNVAARTELNISSRQLKVVVETYYTANAPSSSNRLFVALLQDSLLAPQEGAELNPNAVDSNGMYIHRYIFQDYISAATGLVINNTSIGSFRADTFYYTLPANFNNNSIDFPNAQVAVWIANDSANILNAAYSEKTMVSNNAIAVDLQESAWTSDFDLICGSESGVVLLVKNMGSTALNNIQVDYNINSGAATGNQLYSFTPALPIGYSRYILLPSISGLNQSTNTVLFNIGQINGQSNPNLDTLSASINHASLFVSDSTNGVFVMRFDGYPADIAWELRDETADTVAVSGSNNATPNTTLTQYFRAANGHCYSLKVTDAYGDGLCCTFGHGYYQLSIGGLRIIRGNEFGFESGLKFTWQEGVTAIQNIDNEVFDWSIFPNPAQDLLNLDIQNRQTGDISIEVSNVLGQNILPTQVYSPTGGIQRISLPVSELASGMYFVSLRQGSQVSTRRLLIARP